MKHHNHPQNHNPKAADSSRPVPSAELNQDGVDFAASADEVARRAYFAYVNQGSLPGHDVQHWLEAESELLVERDLTRAHGFHNRT